jgi:cysteine desulfurase
VIYLDHNATTPVDPRVVEVMLPMFTRDFANAASKHAAGQTAAARVERARRQVAALTGTRRRSIVFTSGATEAANLAIRGAVAAAGPDRRRILVGATEHKAVIAAAEAAAASSAGKIEQVGVHRDGTLDFGYLRRLLADDVAVVAVAAANNETGAINDVSRAAWLAHRAGALLFCDIAQAVGKIPVALDAWDVDLAAWSAHKLYGPKGVGALAADRTLQARLAPLIAGGGQERGLRSGTVDTAGIVGFGEASRLAALTMDAEAERQRHLVRLLQRLLVARLAPSLPGIEVNGPPLDQRLPNTVNLRFAGVAADAVLACLSGVLVSSGAACGSADELPSHVLLAMGLDQRAAAESLRFSLGRTTTEEEIRTAADLVGDAVDRVRSLPS